MAGRDGIAPPTQPGPLLQGCLTPDSDSEAEPRQPVSHTLDPTDPLPSGGPRDHLALAPAPDLQGRGKEISFNDTEATLNEAGPQSAPRRTLTDCNCGIGRTVTFKLQESALRLNASGCSAGKSVLRETPGPLPGLGAPTDMFWGAGPQSSLCPLPSGSETGWLSTWLSFAG